MSLFTTCGLKSRFMIWKPQSPRAVLAAFSFICGESLGSFLTARRCVFSSSWMSGSDLPLATIVSKLTGTTCVVGVVCDAGQAR